MKRIVLFVFLSCILSFSQVKEIPDTPEVSTTCTEKDGKLCPEWLHKLIGQYPPLPYGPLTPITRPVTFWTFRSWNEVPLRSNKKELTSKVFLIMNGLFAASVIVDVKYTHGARENGGSEYPVIPAIVGIDYLADRFFSRSLSIEAPIYGIQHYLRDAVKGP